MVAPTPAAVVRPAADLPESRRLSLGVSDGGCRGAVEVERPMPTLSNRTPAAALLGLTLIATSLFASTAATVTATGVQAGSGLAATTSQAGNHGRSSLGDARGVPIGRTIGSGHRVDTARAAREAAASPRPLKATKRLHVDLGAGRATGSPKASTRLTVDGTASRQATGTTIAPQVVANVQPAPVITTEFAGITRADACTCEPPDPWVAASPTHVVQTTNGLVRISNRSGTPLLSIPTWALFAVPIDRADSDPRILWDDIHKRWVGVLTTYNGDWSESSLQLAVSEASDPTGAWIVYPIDTSGILADYPGISSSSSRIVLTSDDFQDEVTFLGPTWIQIDWANITAGTDLYIGGISSRPAVPAFAHFRPAIMLSSAANTPIIYEQATDTTTVPGYFEIKGSAHDPDPFDDRVNLVENLNTEFGIEAFTLPPVPVQPGAHAIAGAADERPTDAVYRSGQLWFVATADYDDGPSNWDRARWTRVSTTANGAAPTAAMDVFLFASGTHYLMPGIGINSAGSAFMAVTAVDPVSVFPTTLVGGYMAGSGPSPFVEIETSPAAYIGDRWGDYLGIAADPVGGVWLAHELADADGDWRTTVVRIVSDGTPPGVPGTVSQAPVVPSTVGATAAVKVSWGAAADPDSGIASYIVERSDDGGLNFFGAQKVLGTSIIQPLILNHFVQYRITAIDALGFVGLPRLSTNFRPILYQSTTSTTLTGSWSTASSPSFSVGATRYSTDAGATATFTASSVRSIGIVATKATTRGSFRVYVDGVYKATISTYSTTTKFRQLVYQFSWSSTGTHKVKIVIAGTSGHPRVDLDAFVVIR